jgi:hypothetical protein
MKENISVQGHKGTWYEIDSAIIDGKELFLMEHEAYGDEVPCVIVDENNNLVMDEVCNGFDDYYDK